MQNREYIEKWLSGSLAPEEAAVFEKSEDFKKLHRMDMALKQFKPQAFNHELIFDKIKAGKLKRGKVVQFNWPMLVRVAALLVVGLGIGYLIWNSLPERVSSFQTQAGETLQIELPDQSRVTLNAMSRINYTSTNWDEERIINLEGEAFFKVEKGSTFTVITKSGSVTVLGTQFNVKDRNNFYEVSCFEGKVKVSSNTSSVQLTAQQTYREVAKNSSRLTVTGTTPTWFNSESSFLSVPYAEVLHELERQYDVTISTNAIDTTQLFTGRFPNTDRDTALKSVTLPFNLVYQIKGKEVFLRHAE